MSIVATALPLTAAQEVRAVGLEDLDTSLPRHSGRLLRELAVIELPLPGGGRTIERFDALRAAGERDLTVARLWEAHADALAIIAEIGTSPTPATMPTPMSAAMPVPMASIWAVWAAEPPNARLRAEMTRDGTWRLFGRKAWCSGAGLITHALVTADAADGTRLFGVDLADVGVTPLDDAWPAPALSGTDTRSVAFNDVPAIAVGDVRAYLERPGFWWGAAGVAAVWLGGATAVARRLLAAADKPGSDNLLLSQLGAVDAALAAGRASMDVTAAAADADARDVAGRAALLARRARANVERAVDVAIGVSGRALGPGPLAMDSCHSKLVADLGLYVRQSHAERDLADLAQRLLERGDDW